MKYIITNLEYILAAKAGLVVIGEKQINPAYDPERSNNGGGYDQPEYTFRAVTKPELTFVLSDTSCGDFGTRLRLSIFCNGEFVAGTNWGTMEGYSAQAWARPILQAMREQVCI